MTKGTVFACAALAVVVLIAYNRDVARATRYADLDRRHDSLTTAHAATRDSLLAAQALSRRVDSVHTIDTVIINTGIVQSQREADKLRTLLPQLAAARSTADSVPLLLKMYDARTNETIHLRRALTAAERSRSLLLQDRDRWRGVALRADSVATAAVNLAGDERDARACRFLRTFKAPCIGGPVVEVAKAAGIIGTWEKIIKPLLRQLMGIQ